MKKKKKVMWLNENQVFPLILRLVIILLTGLFIVFKITGDVKSAEPFENWAISILIFLIILGICYKKPITYIILVPLMMISLGRIYDKLEKLFYKSKY